MAWAHYCQDGGSAAPRRKENCSVRSGPASARLGVVTVLIVHADDMICSDILRPVRLAAAVWLLTALSGRTNPVVVHIVPTSLPGSPVMSLDRAAVSWSGAWRIGVPLIRLRPGQAPAAVVAQDELVTELPGGVKTGGASCPAAGRRHLAAAGLPQREAASSRAPAIRLAGDRP